jgi:hypothetical protein
MHNPSLGNAGLWTPLQKEWFPSEFQGRHPALCPTDLANENDLNIIRIPIIWRL